MKTVAIILNTPFTIAHVDESDVICADAGYKHLNGITPIAVVGDFDSNREIPSNVKSVTYPVEKNETDGQLAVDYAKRLGYDKVVIYGALGGKIEHVLGNIGLLGYAESVGLSAIIVEPDLTIELVSGNFARMVKINTSVSFVPFDGDVLVNNSGGLHYPLNNLLLKAGTNRGISNIAEQQKIGLDIAYGRLLYIRYL